MFTEANRKAHLEGELVRCAHAVSGTTSHRTPPQSRFVFSAVAAQLRWPCSRAARLSGGRPRAGTCDGYLVLSPQQPARTGTEQNLDLSEACGTDSMPQGAWGSFYENSIGTATARRRDSTRCWDGPHWLSLTGTQNSSHLPPTAAVAFNSDWAPRETSWIVSLSARISACHARGPLCCSQRTAAKSELCMLLTILSSSHRA